MHIMRLTLVLVCTIVVLAAGCGETDSTPSTDAALADAVLPEPKPTDPRADIASEAIWDFADAFNEHDWTLASRFVLPLYADMFREGVEHAAQTEPNYSSRMSQSQPARTIAVISPQSTPCHPRDIATLSSGGVLISLLSR